ncbi:hypothetical protein [Sandaracinus amylolyticus]|uniref:Tryptophan synthase alpha chain n=1 Tax=Sandaracinus amylolyticus TaxID=927083 RepID=A0A0F6SFG6_9BACT|nr:hypothetical protein [Sandaracinus amylolyticus]AKF06909.1 hypothetical protein DB32_004058 [Sandaracinus amylolyticus]
MRAIRTSASRASFAALLACTTIFTVACGDDDGTSNDAGTGMDAARSDASAPACTTTGPENTAAACSDGCDNEADPDGFADCDDRDCCGVRSDCPATTYCGRQQDGGTVMECETPGDENTAAACSNDCDDDGNGFADCNDFDCCDLRSDCPASTACGRSTMRDGGMRCDAGGGVENTAELCDNGVDDDCDGFADCEDFGCCSRVSCGAETACGRRPDGGPRPDGGNTACETRGPENTVEACMDGCDNDGNGFFDCRDRNCCLVLEAGGMRCTTGFCSTFNPGTVNLCPGDDVTMPPEREATLAACSNDCDDDRNGFEDCGDRGCCLIRSAGGSACGAGTYCATFNPGMVNLCAGDDVTMDPGTENTAETCGNSCDDDRDGFEDCEDRDCCEVRTDCGASTYCGMRD